MKKLFFQSIAVAALALFSLTSCNLGGIDNPADPEEEQVDERINVVIPQELLDQIKDYMPIYDGVNPPNVEGTFLIDPYVYVYTSDGFYEAGHQIDSYLMRFYNQNMTTNTLDYNGRHVTQDAFQNGNGVFISGTGNNFTIYFNTEGESYGIYLKTALIVSGTLTADGIANLRRAFVCIDKGDDPDGDLLDVGTFRVFKDNDELCERSEWPAEARSMRPKTVKNNLIETAK